MDGLLTRVGRSSVLLVVLASLTVVSCGSDQPIEVVAIQVGRSRNADRTVAEQTTSFRPDQTMYAAVITDGGRGRVKITARWSYYGRVVNEATEEVSPQGRTVTGFLLQGSGGGFPDGPYKLEILIDDQVVGEREVRVQS